MMASGAQILSTDYPVSEPARWLGHYVVTLPGRAVARCNPVKAPVACSIALK
jgi:Phosphoinositide phospholipase C, Ca2+-dependent